jgi:hypothetical protein
MHTRKVKIGNFYFSDNNRNSISAVAHYVVENETVHAT